MSQILRGHGFIFKYVNIESVPNAIKSFARNISFGKSDFSLLKKVDCNYDRYIEIDYGGYSKLDKLPPYAIFIEEFKILIHYPKNGIPYKITFHNSGTYSSASKTYFLDMKNPTDLLNKLYFDNKYGIFIENYEEVSFDKFFEKLLPKQQEFVIKNLYLFSRQE